MGEALLQMAQEESEQLDFIAFTRMKSAMKRFLSSNVTPTGYSLGAGLRSLCIQEVVSVEREIAALREQYQSLDSSADGIGAEWASILDIFTCLGYQLSLKAEVPGEDEESTTPDNVQQSAQLHPH